MTAQVQGLGVPTSSFSSAFSIDSLCFTLVSHTLLICKLQLYRSKILANKMAFTHKNLILNTDSYKASMYLQYPPGTTGVYSYIEARGGRFPITLMFGLQAYIKNYLLTPVTMKDIDEAEVMWKAHGLPFNRSGWEYIVSKHGGLLPVRINAVPEGTVVPYKNVLCTVENTDPECFWVTTWLETSLLRAIWYPTTVSTQSKTLKNIIKGYLEETGDVELLPFKLHDFGARGVSSLESAGLGGAAHLVNFMGSDTMSGVLFAREFYNADIAGYSIPASEHSTITSWGKTHEVDAYRNMVTQFGQKGKTLAVVSDSYDIYNAVRTLWGEELRAEVVASGATVVIRPDSGDPKTVCSSLVDILGEKFGYTVNGKGFKVLNNVRLIQGDGVNEETIRAICDDFKSKGKNLGILQILTLLHPLYIPSDTMFNEHCHRLVN